MSRQAHDWKELDTFTGVGIVKQCLQCKMVCTVNEGLVTHYWQGEEMSFENSPDWCLSDQYKMVADVVVKLVSPPYVRGRQDCQTDEEHKLWRELSRALVDAGYDFEELT